MTLPLNRNAARRVHRPRGGYNVGMPSVKPEVADRLRLIEAAAPRPRAANARCCGACKTPYNCGKPGCPCHQ